jgi:hypothetical protein
MYKAIVALATGTVIAAAFLSSTAQACVDGAPCPPSIPNYKQYIPKGVPPIPEIPSIPKGSLPKLPPKGMPKAPTKALAKDSQQKVPKKVEKDADASRAAPKASDSDVKVVEKPASVRKPEPPTPACSRYMPSLGKAVEIPCE